MPEEVLINYPEARTVKLSEVLPDLADHGILFSTDDKGGVHFIAEKRIVITAGDKKG